MVMHGHSPSLEMSGPEQTLIKSPNVIPPPVNFRVGGKVLPASIKATLNHRTIEQRSVIGHSSEQ